MTATLPLPSGASGASAFRALNVGPMSLTVRDGALALELDGAGLAAVGAELGLLPGLQAAISSAALRPAALRPALFAREDKNVPRFRLPAWQARPASKSRAAAPRRPRPARRTVPRRQTHRARPPRATGRAAMGDEQAATCHSSWSLLPSAAVFRPVQAPLQAAHPGTNRVRVKLGGSCASAGCSPFPGLCRGLAFGTRAGSPVSVWPSRPEPARVLAARSLRVWNQFIGCCPAFTRLPPVCSVAPLPGSSSVIARPA